MHFIMLVVTPPVDSIVLCWGVEGCWRSLESVLQLHDTATVLGSWWGRCGPLLYPVAIDHVERGDRALLKRKSGWSLGVSSEVMSVLHSSLTALLKNLSHRKGR